MLVNRRRFLGTLAAAAAASRVRAQTATLPPRWPSPVLDCHFHLRADAEANIAHMDGCGVERAVILTRDAFDRSRAFQMKYPARVVWAAAADITTPTAAERLTQAVRDGAVGFGELKFHVEADGPELQRIYALAAELGVPVLVHFQEVDHFPGEGRWSSGFARFETMLRKYPKTTFVGHADAFWANVDARYANEAAYPTGPIARGGLTDRLLGDYPNLFGDMSANSGNNAMSRDAAFTSDFLTRHQNKLIFGSDCSCTDGRGAGISQNNNPTAARMNGKCVARETLTVLQGATSAAVFRKIAWDNGHRVYKLART